MEVGMVAMRVVAVALVLVAHLIWQESPFVFGVPENLGPVINTSSFDGGPSLSADGLTLYLASARRGGVGGDDLWMSIRRTQSDPWQPPVNLGSTVNSTAGDASPSISSNGLELYFDSGRPGGQGSADIWVTTRAEHGRCVGHTAQSRADRQQRVAGQRAEALCRWPVAVLCVQQTGRSWDERCLDLDAAIASRALARAHQSRARSEHSGE
jgi:hypothetical protein